MIFFAFIGALLTFCGGAYFMAWVIAVIMSSGDEPDGQGYACGFGVVLFTIIFVTIITIFIFHSDPESFGYTKIPTETVEEVTK